MAKRKQWPKPYRGVLATPYRFTRDAQVFGRDENHSRVLREKLNALFDHCN
jgi:hypothetical protein